LARLEQLKQEVTDGMEAYELWRAVKPLQPFITDLSTWYVRRSRDRFKGSDEKDKQDALSTLFTVLSETSKIMAPFTPFIAEALHQRLKSWDTQSFDSVHLAPWPEAVPSRVDPALITDTEVARQIIELGHALRAKEKIKVRQPLAAMSVTGVTVPEVLRDVILEELNIKAVVDNFAASAQSVSLSDDQGVTITFDTHLTPELEREGLRREFVRQVNALRKQLGLTINDGISLTYKTESASLSVMLHEEVSAILRDTLATSIAPGEGEHPLKVNTESIAVSCEVHEAGHR
jgi:isoleucyl-tRNA synthetase